MTRGRLLLGLGSLVLLVATACSDPGPKATQPQATRTESAQTETPQPRPTPAKPRETPPGERTTSRPPTRASTPSTPNAVAFPEPGPGMPAASDYFTSDRRLYRSPWYAGEHRLMLGFGCTPAHYYDADPRCPDGEGSHHGIDIAMPCGTAVFSALPGVVLDAAATGTLGPAYGSDAFLIRDRRLGVDVVLGHAERLLVASGTPVQPGRRVALSGHNGAPDGCHLHVEVRPVGTSYTDAVNPRSYLRLSAP